MRAWIAVAALLLLLPMMTALAAAPPELEPLGFLLGEWLSAGTGQPGEPTGKAEFSLGLQGRIILRNNYADYPAAVGRPGSRHEDLMVIYALPSDSIRADYYDSEGHAIRYVVQVPEPSHAIFLSELKIGQPRFRLSYRLEATGVLKGAFDIAPPGQPEAFKPYLAWESRQAEGADK
jgi:hypothetical protein